MKTVLGVAEGVPVAGLLAEAQLLRSKVLLIRVKHQGEGLGESHDCNDAVAAEPQ